MKSTFQHHVIVLLLCSVSAGCATPVSLQRKKEDFSDYTKCELSQELQASSAACGAACLAALLRYWGKEITQDKILSDYPLSKGEGYSLLSLKAIAIEAGLSAFVQSFQKTPEENLLHHLRKGRPLICAVKLPNRWHFGRRIPLYGRAYRSTAWRFGPKVNHYIIVYGFKDDRFLFMDPAYGQVSMSRARFLTCWAKMKYAALLCSS